MQSIEKSWVQDKIKAVGIRKEFLNVKPVLEVIYRKPRSDIMRFVKDLSEEINIPRILPGNILRLSVLNLEIELENIFRQNKKDITELSKNWDGYDAPPIKEITIERVFELLRQIYKALWKAKIKISIPLIQPVPDGSIDINWETDQFELLINVPKDKNLIVSLYGEKLGYPQDEIEHRSHYDLISKVIIEWLKKIQ